MPKVTMEFNLPEDNESYQIHRQAVEMSICLSDIYNYLRRLDKYGHNFKDADEAVSKIREEFHMICSELQDII